jgi:hypothetical protein
MHFIAILKWLVRSNFVPHRASSCSLLFGKAQVSETNQTPFPYLAVRVALHITILLNHGDYSIMVRRDFVLKHVL